MIKKLLFTLCLLVLLTGQLLVAEDKGPQTIEALQHEIEQLLKQHNTPGAAVAIVSRSKVEWLGTLGLADVAENKPVTAKTIFRIASVSKGFAALAALKLQEEGKLKLSDTLQKWVPVHGIQNPWESTDPVRLVHLLEHTSGIADAHLSEVTDIPSGLSTQESLAFAPHYRVARWRPGSRSSYSNVGSGLAGAVVEKAAGQRFEDYVREHIFLPLGMTTASFFRTPEVEQNLTKMYVANGQRMAPYRYMLYRPSGAINASVEDMARYVRFYLQRGNVDGRRIVSAASLDRMEKPNSVPAVQIGVTTGYGLFNRSEFERGHEMHGHNGGVRGGRTTLRYSPELDFGYVVMINSSNTRALISINSAVQSYLMRDVKDASLPPTHTLSPERQNELTGYYANIAPREAGAINALYYFAGIRKVEGDDNGMAWRILFGRKPERWEAVSDELFRRKNASKPAMALLEGESGQILLQYELATMEKISSTGLWLLIGGMFTSFPLTLSSILFAFIWGPRKLLGKLPNPGPWSVRCIPLLGSLAYLGFWLIYAFTEATLGEAGFGHPNAWTISLFVTSLAIPLGAVLSVVSVWRHRKVTMNRVAYWHAVLVTLGLVFVTGFFLNWGVIGLRTWID